MYQLCSKVADKTGSLCGYRVFNSNGEKIYLSKEEVEKCAKDKLIMGCSFKDGKMRISRGIDSRLGWVYTLEDGSKLCLEDISPFGFVVVDSISTKGITILIVLSSDASENKKLLIERVSLALKSIGSNAVCNSTLTDLKYSHALKVKNCTPRDLLLLLTKFGVYSVSKYGKMPVKGSDSSKGYISITGSVSRYLITVDDLRLHNLASVKGHKDKEMEKVCSIIVDILSKTTAKFTPVYKVLSGRGI